MSNPINNSAPQFPVRTSPSLQKLSQPGAARANTRADSSIPRHFSGRAVNIAGQQPPLFASQQGEVGVALANRRVNVPGIYLPTGPTDSLGPKGLIDEFKPPSRLTHSPGAAFTPESGGAIGTFRDPDAPPGFSNEIDVPEHWVNPGSVQLVQPFAPYSDGIKLPKPRTL